MIIMPNRNKIGRIIMGSNANDSKSCKNQTKPPKTLCYSHGHPLPSLLHFFHFHSTHKTLSKHKTPLFLSCYPQPQSLFGGKFFNFQDSYVLVRSLSKIGFWSPLDLFFSFHDSCIGTLVFPWLRALTFVKCLFMV